MELGLEPPLAGFFHSVQRLCNQIQTFLHHAGTAVRLGLEAEKIRLIEPGPRGAPGRKALPKLREPCLRLPQLSQSPSPDHRRRREEMRKVLLRRELNQCLGSVLGLAPRPAELLEETRKQQSVRQRVEVSEFAGGVERLAAPRPGLLRIAQRKQRP